MRYVILVLALVPLAGCFSSDTGPDLVATEEEVVEAALPFLVQDHDHNDALAHQAAWNVAPLAYHNGIDQSGDPDLIPVGGYYTELAITDRYAYLGRASAEGGFGGFSILNIENPAAPQFVGAYESLSASDIEVSHDESLAFFSTQRNDPQQVGNHLATTGSGTGAAPRGIHIVDISDKTAPILAGIKSLPVNGPHTLTYHLHENGSEYLIVCTYDLITDPGTGALLGTVPVTQRVLVYRIDHNPAPLPGATLTEVNQFQILQNAPSGKLYFPHDAIVEVHPEGRTLMYVAYWDKGVQIVDFSDPEAVDESGQPKPLQAIGSFTEFGPSSRNNIHQARPFEGPVAGMHVTVAEPEIIQADETGQITFLDTTSPTTPAKLGWWTLPGDLFVTNLDFSPHNFDTFHTKVALAHNHAGVWIIEARDPTEPRSVGFFMPSVPREDTTRPQPYVWGVFEHNGLLYVSDEATGLHIVQYEGP